MFLDEDSDVYNFSYCHEITALECFDSELH